MDSKLPSCNAISEGRPPFSNTSSEAGALSLEVHIENDSDRAENIFSIFRSLHLSLHTQFWTRGFNHVMQSRKAGLILATRARERDLCPYSYRHVSRMTRTKSCLSQNIFIVFLETTFLHVSCYLVQIFFGFRSLQLPLDTQFWTRGFPLVMQSRKGKTLGGKMLPTLALLLERVPDHINDESINIYNHIVI